jgi:hypothetical protein
MQKETRERAAKSEATDRIARDAAGGGGGGSGSSSAAASGGGSGGGGGGGGGTSYSRMTYTAMVVEAVENLADRHGSSIQAVRKYIVSNYPLKQQQTASFNSLTLKAINKAVALEVLEYEKRLYRISAKEKERRKDRERAIKQAAAAAAREASASMVSRNAASSCMPHHICSSCGCVLH